MQKIAEACTLNCFQVRLGSSHADPESLPVPCALFAQGAWDTLCQVRALAAYVTSGVFNSDPWMSSTCSVPSLHLLLCSVRERSSGACATGSSVQVAPE